MNCVYCDRRVQPNSFLCDKHARKEREVAPPEVDGRDFTEMADWSRCDLEERIDAGWLDEVGA